jgi:hypothetical protein
MSDDCIAPKDRASIRKLGGEEALKTATAACHAAEEGRFGYAALMVLKADFHDVPVHQFSSGDTPKPGETPVVKTQDSKAKGK